MAFFFYLCHNILDMKRITPKPEAPSNPDENKPLSFMQRVAYTIIDFGTCALLFFGLYQLALHTPISNNLHKANNEMIEIQIEIGENTGYFVKTYLGEGETTNYQTYSDDDGTYYYTPQKDLEKTYLTALKENKTYQDLKLNYTVNSFAIALGSLFISEINFLFIVPMINKRRATLGILFANGMMISKKYVSKARWYQLLGRFAWIFIIDTSLLYFAAGEVILFIIPVVTLIVSFTNKDRRTVHDLITGVKVIDKATFVPLVDHDVVDELEDKVE